MKKCYLTSLLRMAVRGYANSLSGWPRFLAASRTLRFLLIVALGWSGPFLSASDSWQWLSPSPTGNHINSFVYGGGQFVGVGNQGEIITSSDGAIWTTRESGCSDRLLRVVYDGTRFVAISSGNILTSNDGISWAKQTSPGPMIDLVAGNNLLVAIDGSLGDGQLTRLLTSTDGTNWIVRDSAAQYARMHFANGVFVAIELTGHAVSSTDGLTWTSVQVGAETGWPFSAAGNGRFLLNYGPKTYVSTNGTQWREVSSHPFDSGRQQTLTVPTLSGGVGGSTMGFAGGYFYIQQSRYASDAYQTYRSADGETWTSLSAYWNADFWTMGSGGGVTVGTEVETLYAGPNPSSCKIYSSTDGLAWTDRTNFTPSSGSSLVYGLGRFFSSGLVSSDALSWTLTPFEPTHAAGELVFRITSQFSGSRYTSTNIDSRAITSVAVSSDGVTGTVVDVQMATPRAVAFGAGRYVFVGDGGRVSSSPDGLTWTAGTSAATGNLSAVIFASPH